ncbi:M13 family metallopeptidase [Roseateles oligotrophus]|uniref:M13 family metallopeptidase n=1 Tax=Roseateles oligotrophus TaxID=1769250 RepID=A0ABT2YAZ8_9BURK|nr:M13 family metallopeptidase [Roseateles oligotrophus]MCV2367476.1 M13 family metallopeptidase [Roseateles oligotrophus]
MQSLFKLRALTLLLLPLAGLTHAANNSIINPTSVSSPVAASNSGLDLAGFDAKVRVQDDLFQAVNGGWIKRTVIPAAKGSHGSFEILREQSDAQVRAIVEALAAGSDEAKIGAFYASFMDTGAIDHAGLSKIKPLLAEIDAIGNRQQLAQWLGRAQGMVNTPIQLSVGPDAKEPLVNRLRASQGGLGLPERDYLLNRTDKRMARARADYLSYLQSLARLSGEAQPADAARRVLALETQIAELHWDAVANRDVQKTFNPMTPAELAAKAPGLDWPAFFGAAQLNPIDRLSVTQPSAVIGIAKLLNEAPLADWQLYAKLHSLNTYAEVLPKAFREASFAFHGRAMKGSKAPLPRWMEGSAEVNEALGEAVGKLYVERHYTPAHAARMKSLVDNLMAEFSESIKGLSWMSPQTQAAAQDKLSKYTVKIGHPTKWRDYSALQVTAGEALLNRQRAAQFAWAREAAKAGQAVDRTEWGMTPQTVNAYYDETVNEIVFPAAILQPPFFDLNADDAVNYGGIGAVIGHEISHGFDDQGAQYDGDGMLRNWWTEADAKAFDALGSRLAAQYDAYQALPGKKVNGRLTLGENIADLSGLQIAYKAYLRSLGGKAAPVLAGFSGEQRFFLGFSQIWREKVREQQMLQQLTADPHSPGAFRANGGVVNHDAFHQAFGTKPGDKLFKPTTERIRIW